MGACEAEMPLWLPGQRPPPDRRSRGAAPTGASHKPIDHWNPLPTHETLLTRVCEERSVLLAQCCHVAACAKGWRSNRYPMALSAQWSATEWMSVRMDEWKDSCLSFSMRSTLFEEKSLIEIASTTGET